MRQLESTQYLKFLKDGLEDDKHNLKFELTLENVFVKSELMLEKSKRNSKNTLTPTLSKSPSNS